jgi:hypothetical protein
MATRTAPGLTQAKQMSSLLPDDPEVVNDQNITEARAAHGKAKDGTPAVCTSAPTMRRDVVPHDARGLH